MSWFRDHRFAVSLGSFLVFGSLLALVLGYVGLVLYSTMWSVGGRSIVAVLLDLAPLYLPIIAFLLIATTLSGVAFGWTALKHLSIPRSDRLQSTVKRVERSNSRLNALGLSDFVAPPEQSDEEQVKALKQQYVDGEIDEEEFEREIDRLNTTESIDDVNTSRVRESRETNRR